MRTAAAVDRNQSEIVTDLRALGFQVDITSQLGHGFPDLCCIGHNRDTGRTEILLVEVKMPGAKLTPDEAAWHASLPDDAPVLVATSADEILDWFGAA